MMCITRCSPRRETPHPLADWPRWARTTIPGSKVRCPAIGRGASRYWGRYNFATTRSTGNGRAVTPAACWGVEYLPDLPRQPLRREGLLQKRDAWLEHPVVHDGLVRVAGEVGLGLVRAAWLVVGADIAAALLDDPVDGREAEPGAFSLRFGGEEGLEDPSSSLGTHANAGVAHREHGVGPRLHDRVLAGIRFVELHVGGFDRQLTARGHGIARIHGEIHDDLLELAAVGAHGTQVAARRRSQVDVLADHAPQHLVHVGHDLVPVEDLGGEGLPAT